MLFDLAVSGRGDLDCLMPISIICIQDQNTANTLHDGHLNLKVTVHRKVCALFGIYMVQMVRMNS